MVKIIDHGLAKEDDPMFSRPLWICTVKRVSDFLKEDKTERTPEKEDRSDTCRGDSLESGGISNE